MDNETKEPNDEQMHGASYEQTPDIEGKQLSDGADDAPSPEDRSSNEDDVACKKEGGDSLLTRAIHKLGGKKTGGYCSYCNSRCRLLFAHVIPPIVLHPQALDQCELYKPSHL